jgi:hypothetical protein
MAGNGDDIGCRNTPFGPVMEMHWKRIGWNLKHFFTKTMNPHNDKGETHYGFRDMSHAIVNIPVEYARACPYRAGHWFFYTNFAWTLAAIGVAVKYFFF